MESSSERPQLVITTAGSEEQALQIGRQLVERRLAACVSVLSQGCSVYRWQGRITEEEEKFLLIKTVQRLFPRVREAIRELHSYEVPEILALSVEEVDSDYAAWLRESVDPTG